MPNSWDLQTGFTFIRVLGGASGITLGQEEWHGGKPPHIPSTLVPQLQPEVHHEPQMALDGGADGLECIRHLVETSPAYLRSGGVWLIEMMTGQAQT